MSQKLPFRKYHILQLLQTYSASNDIPVDLCMRKYFFMHKSLGSKDRKEIAQTVYSMIRWKLLLEFLSPLESDWKEKLDTFEHLNITKILNRSDIPDHIRVSFPKILYDLIIRSHGQKRGNQLCLESNTSAPTTVRINPLKTTREEMLKKWEIWDVLPCRLAKFGIHFRKRQNLFSLPEFKAGLFEMQDEGSQLLAELMQAGPGQLVMDYCAGSGGKTLAFAYKLQGKGQIYLHDVRNSSLLESKKRLKRAGIQNAQILLSDEPKLSKLKKKMDWVFVDAPCSGTGTYRRNPDMKWRFTDTTVALLISKQRVIFEKALSYLKPGGHIIYGTCSVLNEENQEQLNHFLKTYALTLVNEPFQSLPTFKGMDGFFGAVMQKTR